MSEKTVAREAGPRGGLRWCFRAVLALGCLGLGMLVGCGPSGRVCPDVGVRLTLSADNGGRPVTEDQRDVAVRVFKWRLDELSLGASSMVSVVKRGEDLIEVEVLSRDGGERLLERVAACVTQPSLRLEFRLVSEREQALLDRLSPDDAPPGFTCARPGVYVKSPDWQEISRRPDYEERLASFGADRLDDATEVRFALEPESDRSEFYRGRFVCRKCWISGEHLKKVKATEAGGFVSTYMLEFTLTDRGTKILAEVTSANVGRQLAILCGDKVVSAPLIREPIVGGVGTITGNFSREEAERLAEILSAGELPVPFRIVSSAIFDPSSDCER